MKFTVSDVVLGAILLAAGFWAAMDKSSIGGMCKFGGVAATAWFIVIPLYNRFFGTDKSKKGG